MKTTIIILLAFVCLFSCSEKKKTIDFVTLREMEFNAKSFETPNGEIIDSLKHAHDSCMGFSFDANAMLTNTRDTFFVGSIVNRKSLAILNTINDLGLSQTQLMSRFNVLTNPCYERRVLQFPLKSLLGENFNLQIPGVDIALNKEINDAIAASDDPEMQTGSWVYLDLKDALKDIMDTTKSSEGQVYKNNLLDTSNMILTTAESVTDVSFIIHSGKSFSEPLQGLLKSKPFVSQMRSQASIQLFYIDDTKFEMTLNGFFPVVGQFMRAELK